MPANDPSHEASSETTARFTPEELAYLLDERRLGRLATTDATAAPHVVPVGWSTTRNLAPSTFPGTTSPPPASTATSGPTRARHSLSTTSCRLFDPAASWSKAPPRRSTPAAPAAPKR
jgi:hypothetical protein